MEKDQIIKEAIQLERNVTTMYKILAQKFPDDKKIWLDLSVEEFTHAQLLEDPEINGFLSSSELLFSKPYFEKLQNYNANITNYCNDLPEKDIHIFSIYEKALEIESFEFEFLTKYLFSKVNNGEKNKAIHIRLQRETEEHLQKIITLLNKKFESQDRNIKTLFIIGMAIEKIAEKIYDKFCFMFRNNTFVADFFRQMKNDEIYHQMQIKSIYEGIPEKNKITDYNFTNVFTDYLKALKLLYLDIHRVRLPYDAIEIAHIIENLDVNMIFKYFVLNHISTSDRQKLMLMQLEEHNSSLGDFSYKYKIMNP